MCSRYNLTSPPEAMRALFGYRDEPDFPPRAEIRPTEPVAIVRHDYAHKRQFALVRWGLIPSWSKDPRSLPVMINARAETAADKASFRGAMRHRRCLVPADGYYEWSGPRGAKTKHFIRQRGGGLMAFAGLWENWLGADGSEIETMAIVTVAANPSVSAIHDRMPVILAPDAHDAWLDCRSGTATGADALLQPAPEQLLESELAGPAPRSGQLALGLET